MACRINYIKRKHCGKNIKTILKLWTHHRFGSFILSKFRDQNKISIVERCSCPGVLGRNLVARETQVGSELLQVNFTSLEISGFAIPWLYKFVVSVHVCSLRLHSYISQMPPNTEVTGARHFARNRAVRTEVARDKPVFAGKAFLDSISVDVTLCRATPKNMNLLPWMPTNTPLLNNQGKCDLLMINPRSSRFSIPKWQKAAILDLGNLDSTTRLK